MIYYSKNEEKHMIHLREILLILRKQKFNANLKKCDFFSPSVIFLGDIASKDGIRMDPSKVEANWPTPS